jgi:hypothetical protein
MSEFKVRAVDFEEKSVQEVEEQLLNDHEEKTGAEQEIEAQTEGVQENEAFSDTEQPTNETPELDEQTVLSFIKNRYDREIDTIDQLFEAQQTEPELPEDVSTFLKYKKETGRGIQDFIKLNRDLDGEDPNNLLFEYYKNNSDGLDDEDIQFDMQERFSYDEELDDEKEIRQKKIEFKKELAKAKSYFEQMKEQYRVPLESREGFIPESEKEVYEAFKSQAQTAKEAEKAQQERFNFFKQKTEELFNKDFKGFDFNVEDQSISFKPGDPESLKKSHSNLNDFFQGFLDENGFLKDPAAYHRAIAVAMNPDAFARYFYEQGKSQAIDNISKESKNIDMGVNKAPQVANKSGFKVTALDSGDGRRLVIKSKK